MRKTKIVCTIGPACTNEQTIREMCLAGMNVARLNFSHGTHEDHLRAINMIKKVRDELELPIAILLDTKGPEYRIGTFENGKIQLATGDNFSFSTEDIVGDEKRVSVNYKGLPKEMSIGDTILLNNGLVIFEVTGVTDTTVDCRVVVGGELSNRKSMSFPGKLLKQVYLSENDKRDIKFGIENEVDFIACSFVSTRQDLIDVKEYIASIGGADIDIIAKIENRSGVDNITEICKDCDGIMVARGDMGVEIPFEELPNIQKYLITKCRLLGKRVITATEMLESMIYNPRPTRAEISDVANAVYDGTSAIMLSGETAAGLYPVESVQTMVRIAERTEQDIDYRKRFLHYERHANRNVTDAVCHATCTTAIDLNASAIVTVTKSGTSARNISKYRPVCPIIAGTTSDKVCRQLNMSWGVTPVHLEEKNEIFELFDHAVKASKDGGMLKAGETVVVTAGVPLGVSGNTNMIKVQVVE